VKRGRPTQQTAIFLLTVMLASRGLAAQVAATVDLGVAGVHYDGFLPSSAGSVSPALRYERPQLFVLASGSYLRFESGHHSLQGNLTASAFTPTVKRLRGELLTSVGASGYADFARFSHALIGPGIHLAGDREGVWLRGGLGTTSYGGAQHPVTTAALGTWAERFAATWLLSGTFNQVGDTSYTDVEGALHARRWRFTFDGVLGVRGWSHGGGHGVYGEASGALAAGGHLAIVVSGGRYPTDPIRGSVSGRYLGVAVRLTALPWRSLPTAVPALPKQVTPLSPSGADGAADPPSLTVQLRSCACDGRTLVVLADAATTVEVSGDFTDWEPLSLSSRAPGEWAADLPLRPGTYRFNVRVNGGDWTVPAGVTAVMDEFGGRVALLTVP